GWLAVVGVGQQQVQELGVRGAGGGEGAVGVLRGAGRSPGRQVDQRVAGAGVVGQRLRAADEGAFGDAADVQGDVHAGFAGQPEGVEHAGQRGAVAAGGDVPGAQVGDDRQAGRFGDPGGLADLQRSAGSPVLDPVEGGLAEGGDEVDRFVAEFTGAAEI